VVLKIEDQNLKDLNSYFFPSDGIELLGRLHFGLGVVSLDGSVLRSTVTARYSDFNLTLNANKERSGLEAFFGNLLSGLKIDDGDLDEGRKGQAASVELRRKKEESVVSALLRGLREAVLKVATT
jgi:hypothetical protein